MLLPLGKVGSRIQRLLLLKLLLALARRREASARIAHLATRLHGLLHLHLGQLRHAACRVLAQLFLHVAVA